MKEKIKNILIEEFSKINNVNYKIEIHNLKLKINTKRIIPLLIDYCETFEAGINSSWRFDYKKKSYFWLSYKHIWSKFEKETGLKYDEIQSLVKSLLEEGFNLKGITPLAQAHRAATLLEEGFNLKGITPLAQAHRAATLLEEGFNLKGITPESMMKGLASLLEEGFNLKEITPDKYSGIVMDALEEGFNLKGIIPKRDGYII